MYQSKFFISFLILSALCFSGRFSIISAQEKKCQTNPKIDVTMIAAEEEFSALDKEVMDCIRNVLKEKGLLCGDNENFDTELLVDVKEVDGEGDNIIISITTMLVIPPEIIELGKNAQVFFTVMDKEKNNNLPEEGREVREYVSAEYVKQFRILWDNSLEVISHSQLTDYCSKFVENKFGMPKK